MINMDSADESEIVVGCAGGQRSDIVFSTVAESCSMPFVKVSVKGLFGGHSGEDINKGRANANKLMGRALLTLKDADVGLRLISVDGGTKENAIPRETTAVVSVTNAEKARAVCTELCESLKEELVSDDKDFCLAVSECKIKTAPMTEKWSDRCIFFLASVANGILEMDNKVDGIVEYSRNLGIVTTDEQKIEFVLNTRSAREARLDHAERELNAYASALEGIAEHFNRYPGWVFSESSALRETYLGAYEELFGEKTQVEIIHAGLECGIIKKAIPDMDVISCGPYVRDLHSPCESLDLRSFERFFSVILRTLEKIK
jgi:dipeptidase D